MIASRVRDRVFERTVEALYVEYLYDILVYILVGLFWPAERFVAVLLL